MPKGIPNLGVRRTGDWEQKLANKIADGFVPKLPVLMQPKVSRPPSIPREYTNSYNIPVMPSVVESDEEITTRLAERFDIISVLTDSAISGDLRSLFISGPAGVGKSYTVFDHLNKFDPEGKNYTIVKGSVRATGLYRMFWKHRLPGQILVFDDADTIFFDDVCLNLLKAVCDTTAIRNVSWLSEYLFVNEEDAETIPKSFQFDGTIIFISNLDFDELVEKRNKLTPHLEALMSRSHYVNMGMRTRRDCMIRIKQVCIDQKMLENVGLDETAQSEIITFLEENIDKLRELSLRTAIKIANLRKSKPNDWRRLVKVSCLK